VLTYGPLEDHVADLWLPSGGGQSSVLVLFIHGGFWRAEFDRRHIGPLAEALAANGLPVCVPEYRRVGEPGGGWPGTFDDIRAAVTTLPGTVAGETNKLVSGFRLIVAGHSAGGHLALWSAAELAGAWDRPFAVEAASSTARIRSVVSLAGVCDLAGGYRQGLGHDAVAALMGGGPVEYPERYRAADPMALLPTRVRTTLVHGLIDDRVPASHSRDYAARAAAAGDEVQCVLLPSIGHFEVIDPTSAAWPSVLAELRSAAQGRPENP
jgi:acetyl esterase/lipase